ncbi:MAG: hypothetical protein LBD16_00945 [Oscillospiraceae bacterium]|jgi:1-acyl-sn-glycerol-3-phosphate acyltransferase|nr:hypothetical protein [Oscillospiraceae bacterium]
MEQNEFAYGRFFKAARFGFRMIRRRVHTPEAADFAAPAVYIGHHQNLKGPFNVMLWINVPIRLWVLSVFTNGEKCRRQLEDYTFKTHYPLPKPLAWFLANVAGAVYPKLMRSLGAIEVYRKDEAVQAIKTFRASTEALCRGERVLIFPDMDNESDDYEMGEIYKGFLYLEKHFHTKTGRHLPFIPIHYNDKKRRIKLGSPIMFGDGDMDDQIGGISAMLVNSVNKLAL